MKKLFKIIPLTCLATTMTAVAPLMTSCSKETKYVFDLTSAGYNHKPKKVPLDSTKDYNRITATEPYFKMIKEEPMQFVYDYMYGRNKFIHSIADESGANIKSFTLSSTLPKFGETTVSYSHMPDMTYPTASFTIEGHLETTINLDTSKNANNNKMDVVFDWKVKYTDAIFYVYQDTTRGVANSWTVGMMDLADSVSDAGCSTTYLFNNNPWSIDVHYNCDATTTFYDPETGTQTSSTQNYQYDKKISDYYTLNDILELTFDYRYGSYDTFPIGFLWYLIPMDFASNAFTFTNEETGEDVPILHQLGITFKSLSSSWKFTNSNEDPSQLRVLSAVFPGQLFISGLPESSTVTLEDNPDNKLTYNNGAYKLLMEDLSFSVARTPRAVESWDLTITWDLSDKDDIWNQITNLKSAGTTLLNFDYKQGFPITKIDGQTYTSALSDGFWRFPMTIDISNVLLK